MSRELSGSLSLKMCVKTNTNLGYKEASSAGPRMNILLQNSPNIDIQGLPGISRILSVTEIVILLMHSS
jgi:hypothetical protein